MSSTQIEIFNKISEHKFEEEWLSKIKSTININSKNYILEVDEEEFINYLIDEYTLEPIEIIYEKENISEPQTSKKIKKDLYDIEVNVYTFTLRYPFTGHPQLFRLRPNKHTLIKKSVSVNYHGWIEFDFSTNNLDVKEFKQAKEEVLSMAFANLQNVNNFAKKWNDKLRGIIETIFIQLKNKYQEENAFFKEVNIKINNSSNSLTTVPTIKKKIIPQPIPSSKTKSAEQPTISKEIYNDILKVIYDFGTSLEKKKSTFTGKSEDQIRDILLTILETRYDSATATGETFNHKGKSDILIKYSEDNSNLFIAECKIWYGLSEFLKAISQLFDRYLTWRDSKAALIFFVKNKDFTNVLETIKKDIKTHQYYLRENGIRRESSFSYIFTLPSDKHKEVFLEVIAFNFYEH